MYRNLHVTFLTKSRFHLLASVGSRDRTVPLGKCHQTPWSRFGSFVLSCCIKRVELLHSALKQGRRVGQQVYRIGKTKVLTGCNVEGVEFAAKRESKPQNLLDVSGKRTMHLFQGLNDTGWITALVAMYVPLFSCSEQIHSPSLSPTLSSKVNSPRHFGIKVYN